MLSPYIDYLSYFFDKKRRSPKEDVVSFMIKMADDSAGPAEPGTIRKELTMADRERLERTVLQCRDILARMSIPGEETFLCILNAGHPGGMLPLTEETQVTVRDPRLPENLYAADASLFPKSAGLPPILTIMALSLRAAEMVEEKL